MSIADGILEAFGSEISVSDGKAQRCSRGFISPLNIKDTQPQCTPLPVGVKNDASYLLICAASALTDGKRGKMISCLQTEYELVRAEPVYFCGELSHWEGILKLKGRKSDVQSGA